MPFLIAISFLMLQQGSESVLLAHASNVSHTLSCPLFPGTFAGHLRAAPFCFDTTVLIDQRRPHGFLTI